MKRIVIPNVDIPRNLTAQAMAQALNDRGIQTLRFEEGDTLTDGEVAITEMVHIQVSFFGQPPGVVRQLKNGSFKFSTPRTKWAELEADIAKAKAATD